jgi:hypothetical protein
MTPTVEEWQHIPYKLDAVLVESKEKSFNYKTFWNSKYSRFIDNEVQAKVLQERCLSSRGKDLCSAKKLCSYRWNFSYSYRVFTAVSEDVIADDGFTVVMYRKENSANIYVPTLLIRIRLTRKTLNAVRSITSLSVVAKIVMNISLFHILSTVLIRRCAEKSLRGQLQLHL